MAAKKNTAVSHLNLAKTLDLAYTARYAVVRWDSWNGEDVVVATFAEGTDAEAYVLCNTGLELWPIVKPAN